MLPFKVDEIGSNKLFSRLSFNLKAESVSLLLKRACLGRFSESAADT